MYLSMEACNSNTSLPAIPTEGNSQDTGIISPRGFSLTHSCYTNCFPIGIPTNRRLLSPYVMDTVFPSDFFIQYVMLMVVPVRPGFSRSFFLSKVKAPKVSHLQRGISALKMQLCLNGCNED